MKTMTSSRVETTLFLLMSVDGKITSGETDDLDPDRDWKRIAGVKEGLHQYYEIQQTTDLHDMNTARVMAKLGVNTPGEDEPKPGSSKVSLILIDRKPHLTEHGVRNLIGHRSLYVVTNNRKHPALALTSEFANLEVVYYPCEIDFPDLLKRLKQEYGVERVTIESGGTLNSVLVRQGLIDHLSIVVAPLLVGGQSTPSLIGGPSLQTEVELANLRALKLVECRILEDSYVHLQYDVINETIIDPR